MSFDRECLQPLLISRGLIQCTLRSFTPSWNSCRIIFAESLEVLMMPLEALHEEVKPLGLQVSWPKTKVQVFEDLLVEK